MWSLWPVWVLMCLFKSPLVKNIRVQASHLYSLDILPSLSWCRLTCWFKVKRDIKVLLQCSHICFSSFRDIFLPLCIAAMWHLIADLWANFFPHVWHSNIKVLSRGFADSGSGNQFPGPDWAISGLFPDPELANVGHFPDPVGHFPDPESAFPADGSCQYCDQPSCKQLVRCYRSNAKCRTVYFQLGAKVLNYSTWSRKTMAVWERGFFPSYLPSSSLLFLLSLFSPGK